MLRTQTSFLTYEADMQRGPTFPTGPATINPAFELAMRQTADMLAKRPGRQPAAQQTLADRSRAMYGGPLPGGAIHGIPAGGTYSSDEVGADGRLTPEAIWRRFHPDPLAGVVHGRAPGSGDVPGEFSRLATEAELVNALDLARRAQTNAGAPGQMDAAKSLENLVRSVQDIRAISSMTPDQRRAAAADLGVGPNPAGQTMRNDTQALADRGNLFGYSQTQATLYPASGRTVRFEMPAGPVQWGFKDKLPGGVVEARPAVSAIDRLRAMRGGASTRNADLRAARATSLPQNVNPLASVPGSPQNNMRARFGASLPLSEAEQALADWQNAPGHNTLSPADYLTRAAEDDAVGLNGTPEQARRVSERTAMEMGQQQYMGNVKRRTGKLPDLQANALAYDKNRAATQGLRQVAVNDRAASNLMARFDRMHNPGDGGDLYNPATSAMLGFFMGGPQLAAEYARGAAGENRSYREGLGADRRFGATLAQQQAQLLAELRQRDQQFAAQAEDRKLERELAQHRHDEQIEAIKGQTAASLAGHKEKSPGEIVGAIVSQGGDPTNYINFIRMTKGQEAANAATSGMEDYLEEMRNPGMADIKAGRLSDAAYKKMLSEHPANLFGGWRDWWTTEGAYMKRLKDHFANLFPDIPADKLDSIVRQYYHRYANE